MAAVIVLAAVCVSCGKSGPPLPPLVKLPAPPTDVAAERRGQTVDVSMIVSSANTDGTRPANISRVDVYAITGPTSVTDDQLMKLGSKVASVDVKSPRDPNATVDADEPATDAEPPQGTGLDQGAKATFAEDLTSSAANPVDLSPSSPRRPRVVPEPKPLAGPPPNPPVRVYAGVGVTARGKRGPFSRRASVPMVPAPPPSGQPIVTYDESAITVTWPAAPLPPPAQEPASGDVLPARTLGPTAPGTGYNVYEVKDKVQTRLTSPALTEPGFVDKRLEWGAERCYIVRTVETFDALSIESSASPVVCVTLADTFSPSAPAGLLAVPSEGGISLIWTPNTDKDWAGYIVLRAAAPSETFTPITPAPIQESTFRDAVQPGVRYVYAIQAVDKAGNRSAPSNRTEPTEAR